MNPNKKVLKETDPVPAWPPDDYKGKQSDWDVCLAERGLERGEMISQKDWWEIVEECEG